MGEGTWFEVEVVVAGAAVIMAGDPRNREVLDEGEVAAAGSDGGGSEERSIKCQLIPLGVGGASSSSWDEKDRDPTLGLLMLPLKLLRPLLTLVLL